MKGKSLLARFVGFKLHTAKQRTHRRSRLGVEQLETRAVPAALWNGNVYATIQAAIDDATANPGDDVVKIEAGTYLENLTINDANGALELRGLGANPSAVVINGQSGIGIDVVLQNNVTIHNLSITNSSDGISVGGTANLIVSSVEANGNSATGLSVDGAANVSVFSSTFSDNNGDGISALNVSGTVGLINVVANLNGVPFNVNVGRGVNVRNAGAFVDWYGTYNQNTSHGILMFDIAGDVTMVGTKAVANDTDLDFTGAGVRMRDGGDADIFAVGGNVTVVSGTFDGNRTGFYSSDRIAGNVVLADTTANGNQLEGIRFQDQQEGQISIAGSLTIIGGEANNNERHGLWVEHAIAGDVYLIYFTASGNDSGGVLAPATGVLITGAGEVVIWAGEYSTNEGDGIHIENADSVLLISVTAEDNGDFDLETINSGTPTIFGGSIPDISITP